MAPLAISKLRQRVSKPTTSHSGCLVRSTSPRIRTHSCSTRTVRRSHDIGRPRGGYGREHGLRVRKSARRREGNLCNDRWRLSDSPTKEASKTPSWYGWKSANQDGRCCKEHD